MDTEKLKSDLTSFFNEYEFLRKEKDELNQTKLNRRHEIMNNLFIEWDEELKDSYYRRSYNQGIIRLVNMGLCCGVCGYSRLNDKNQCVCVHPIHRNTLHDIEVEPYQICELVTLGNKYLKFIFDGNSFKRSNPGKSAEKAQERFSHVGFVMREEHYEDLDKIKELNKFIDFFKSEIPDVYEKLLNEFKRRNMEND